MKYRLIKNELFSKNLKSNIIYFIVNEDNEALFYTHGYYTYKLDSIIRLTNNLKDFNYDEYIENIISSHIGESGSEFISTVLLEFSELSELKNIKKSNPELFL